MAQPIILADTQVIFRTGVARVLTGEADLDVVAQCSNLEQFVEATDRFRHSIAVYPVAMVPELESMLDDLELAGIRSVVILEHGATLGEEIAERVHGVFSRSVEGDDLIDCLRRVAAGQRCVRRLAVTPAPALDRVGIRVLKRLTPKELQIVALVTGGGKNRDIAEQLGTKEQVIKNYLRSIYDKTGVSDRLELAVFTQHHQTLADAAIRVRQELRLSA